MFCHQNVNFSTLELIEQPIRQKERQQEKRKRRTKEQPQLQLRVRLRLRQPVQRRLLQRLRQQPLPHLSQLQDEQRLDGRQLKVSNLLLIYLGSKTFYTWIL